MGGLLSAYHLSDEDPLYLEKAVELAERMLPAFNTPSGLPSTMINLQLREGVDDPKGLVSTAEAATIQLEFRYLSFLTDDDSYWDAVERVGILNCADLLGIRLTKQSGYESHQSCEATVFSSGSNLPQVSRLSLLTMVLVQCKKRAVLSFRRPSWFTGGFVL